MKVLEMARPGQYSRDDKQREELGKLEKGLKEGLCTSARIAKMPVFQTKPIEVYMRVVGNIFLPDESSFKIRPSNPLAAAGIIFGAGAKVIAQQAEITFQNIISLVNHPIPQPSV